MTKKDAQKLKELSMKSEMILRKVIAFVAGHWHHQDASPLHAKLRQELLAVAEQTFQRGERNFQAITKQEPELTKLLGEYCIVISEMLEAGIQVRPAPSLDSEQPE